MLVEKEVDRPDLTGFERALDTHLASGVPRYSLPSGGITAELDRQDCTCGSRIGRVANIGRQDLAPLAGGSEEDLAENPCRSKARQHSLSRFTNGHAPIPLPPFGL
jgi:hypothetical protein